MEAKVIDHFVERFKRRPDFVVRCPGRVNLIGEHIDYSGYGVMPMAVQQSIYAAVGASAEPKTLTLSNVDSSRYPDHIESFDSLNIDKSAPKWHHYFFCGVRGMLEHLAGRGDKPDKGMDVVVGSDLPASAGLSSSSALVCCAAICTLRIITGEDFARIDRTAIAELCAKCERYIGTEGGGMDQAICLLAEAGKAKLIEFNPLKTRSVTLPNDACFVVSHCVATMNKAATTHFNERVVECRLSAQVLAKQCGLDWTHVRTLGNLQKQLLKSLSEMAALVKQHLHAEPYTKSEICELLNVSEEELAAKSLSQNTLHMTKFKLQPRALHVYDEAERVYEFDSTCRESSAHGTSNVGSLDGLRALGRLMDESHASCRDSYECSCAELDELQQLAKSGGALGSRLTGAGWGGCVVSLVHASAAAEFVDYLRVHFYKKTPAREAAVATALFISAPAGAAEIKVL